MATAYAVREFSHWQGARNPGAIVAVTETEEEADALVDALSTCSFCTPGRTAQYSIGRCYVVRETTRYQPGYGFDQLDEAVLQDAGLA